MGYYPNPYENVNNTGIAKLLQQQHERLLENDRDRQIRNLSMRNQCLSEQLNEANSKLSKLEPKPEVIKEPTFWSRLFSDPFWEIFKRPTIK